MWTLLYVIVASSFLPKIMAFRIIANKRSFGIASTKIRRRVGYSIIPSSQGHMKCQLSNTCFFSSQPIPTRRFGSLMVDDSEVDKKSISDTPLGSSSASHLLSGLDIYEVCANDGHPISVYGINSEFTNDDVPTVERRPILLLHGRTWSAIPVYHLLGGDNDHSKDGEKNRSLMEAFYSAGLQPYCMDFRGFGGTPMDETRRVIPNRCVEDVESVMDFITSRQLKYCSVSDDGSSSSSCSSTHLPALLGWSQGALVAQLAAQKNPETISKLVLYGSIYDPLVRYARSPLFSQDDAYNTTKSEINNQTDQRIESTFNSAIEDFTVAGSIATEAAILFAEAALLADPYKAEWKYLCQFNNLDPARVHIPTLVIAGDQDPYAPLSCQAELYTNLGRGVDRTWSIIANADHAIHLLDGRERFINIVNSFVKNSKKGEEGEGS